jgi:ABC-2 type transport system ATP-binding protein
MIKIDGLKKEFRNTVIYQELDVEFGKGINLLKGENGTGKSTLLRILVNLDRDFNGKVIFQEEDFLFFLSYVPDEPNFFERVKVRDFIKVISKLKHIPSEDIQKSVIFWNIDQILEKEMGMLSLGQIKRLFLCVSYGKNIKYYVLDEPFNGLDKTYSEKLVIFLEEVSKNSCVVFTCHNQEILKSLTIRSFSIQNKRVVQG